MPWRDIDGWDAVDAKYNIQNLVSDTLRLLEAKTPLKVRMETLRRAAIYCTRHEGLADRLSGQLLARANANESEPNGWFDAGYFAETVRQTGFIYRYGMVSQADGNTWIQRGDKPATDGRPFVEKAIRMGGKGMEPVLTMMEEYSRAVLSPSGYGIDWPLIDEDLAVGPLLRAVVDSESDIFLGNQSAHFHVWPTICPGWAKQRGLISECRLILDQTIERAGFLDQR